jgi:hypothetical protein
MIRARFAYPMVATLLPLLLVTAACEHKVATGLNVGQTADIDGLRVVVDRVEFADVAGGPVVSSTPQAGARYLWVHLKATNYSEVPVDKAILLRLEYRGERVGGVEGVFYGPEHPALTPSLQLFPNLTSQGWRLFEVPATLDLSQVDAVFQFGVVGSKTVTWNLGAGVSP